MAPPNKRKIDTEKKESSGTAPNVTPGVSPVELPQPLQRFAEGQSAALQLAQCLGTPPKTPEAIIAAKKENLNRQRIEKNLKYFAESFDEMRETKRDELLAKANSMDIFKLQSRVFTDNDQAEAYAEMTLLFMRKLNLTPTCGQMSFTVDFADSLKNKNRSVEMSIGLSHILPPAVTKVKVVDTNGAERSGERKIVDGRLGYYDERGYIPIFQGYSVVIIETAAENGEAVKKQAEAERKNFEQLRDEYAMIEQEETEHAAAQTGEVVRLHGVITDTSGRFSKEKEDFRLIEEKFAAAGLQWDERVWLDGGASLRTLNGKGHEMLTPSVMDIFKLLAYGGEFKGTRISGNYSANLSDIRDIYEFSEAIKNQVSEFGFSQMLAGLGSPITGYQFLATVRRYNGAWLTVTPSALEDKSVIYEANGYLGDLLGSDKAGNRIFNDAVQTFSMLGNKRELPELTENFKFNINRLNKFSWAKNSFAVLVDAKKQVLYLLHKNQTGGIDLGMKFRVSLGRRDRLGSNEVGSNGTPAGMMEWYAPDGTFGKLDRTAIGKNMKPSHKERGRAGITSRFLRTRGLEKSNSNSDSRGIFFHGGGYMDGYRGGYEQSWVPRSRGCIVTSNADTIILWSYIRQNFLKGQKVLCDVIL